LGDLTARLSRHEFACKDNCGFDACDIELLECLEDVADHFATRMQGVVRVIIDIRSGNRCVEHNIAEGGVSSSQHVFGLAVDFKLWAQYSAGNRVQIDPNQVAQYLNNKYIGKYGIGWYSNRTHFDVRANGPARWDAR